MDWGRSRRTRAAALVWQIIPVLAALGVAGCNTVAPDSPSASASRGATVSFDSIDGPPRPIFDRLVQDLNAEAQQRQLAIVSRDGDAAYRVRGYLVAQTSSRNSAVSWVWDIYDREHRRVLRLNGEDVIKGKHRDAWQAVDDTAVARIARDSMTQLSAFLGSTEAIPQAVAVETSYAAPSGPEAAGIFRIQQGSNPAPAETPDAAVPAALDSVPLPPQRPRTAALAPLTVAAAQASR
jgi:hypothetical protein